jgi:hypothetical protein
MKTTLVIRLLLLKYRYLIHGYGARQDTNKQSATFALKRLLSQGPPLSTPGPRPPCGAGGTNSSAGTPHADVKVGSDWVIARVSLDCSSKLSSELGARIFLPLARSPVMPRSGDVQVQGEPSTCSTWLLSGRCTLTAGALHSEKGLCILCFHCPVQVEPRPENWRT